ncbi:MAG: DUF1376 domain-containing protein [Pseudomonas sp.]|nr:DUF1376 domain-containing protein [Pseudomonas sp.]
MAKPDIWMPLYIGDYLADTMHLTTEQHGAYLLLIMAYWKNGGAISSSEQSLSATCRLSADAWSMHKHTLASFFDTETDPELWILTRAEMEMEKAGNNQQKRTLRAQKAASARWGNNAPSIPPSIAPSNQQALLKECPSPSPSPLKNKDQEHLSSKPDGQGKSKRAKAVDETPYQQILDCYMEVCGGRFLGAEVLNDKRKRNIKRTYDLIVRNEQPFKDRGIEFWGKYFKRCVSNKHWCGENDRNWKADLEFVTREENVLKVLGV